MCLGAMVGYPIFWGAAGREGVVWSAAGGTLALMLGSREESRDQPLMIPAIAAFLTALTGLCFQLILREYVPIPMYVLRILLTAFSAMLFLQAAQCRDAVTDWLILGVAALALAQVVPLPYLSLGYVVAGLTAVRGPFPAAALVGLGLALAQVTKLPMAAVLCTAYFLGLIPFAGRAVRYLVPGIAYGLICGISGRWDWMPVPGLLLGGTVSAVLPQGNRVLPRRGSTGAAQVRLEVGAEMMGSLQQVILDLEPPPIDQQALVDKACARACSNCSARRNCSAREQMTVALLESPLEADCRKPGRLLPELNRAREQLRLPVSDRARQGEYRWELIQQYSFLGDYLRSLADRLPRGRKTIQVDFRVEVSARSRGKERANGDHCLAFPGTDGRYFVLLCDGMGTGLGAAEESHSAANLLRQMLTAGFPPEHSLRWMNSLLALRGRAGSVTIDLAVMHLDQGTASVYKWLSLSREARPGELAGKVLGIGCMQQEDDATAAVIRLCPLPVAAS